MHKRSVALFQTSSNQRPRLRSTVTANRPWRTRSNARQQAKMASTHSVMATSGCADRYSLSSESQSIQKSLGRRMVVNQIDTEGGSGQTVNATVVEFLVCEQFKSPNPISMDGIFQSSKMKNWKFVPFPMLNPGWLAGGWLAGLVGGFGS